MTVPPSSLVAMALSLGVVCWVLLRSPESPPVVESVAGSDATARLLALQEEFDRRLQRVEATLLASSGARQEATPVSAPAPMTGDGANGFEQRLAAVENLLQKVRSEQLAIGPMPTDLGSVVKALADKNLEGYEVAPELKQRRMDLRRRFLELAPGDPKAGQVLLDLANDYLFAGGARQSIAVLDEFAGRTNVPATRLAMAYANFHGQVGEGDKARSYYDSIARDTAVTETERASARFWHAYSYYQQRRWQEAARGFQALIDSYGDPPPAAVQDSVGGAKNYLQKCREQMK